MDGGKGYLLSKYFLVFIISVHYQYFMHFLSASKNINDWWLSYWVTHSHDGGPINNTAKLLTSTPIKSRIPMETSVNIPPTVINSTGTDNLEYWLGIYGGLAAANSVFTLLRAFLFAYGGLCAATVAHKNLLRSILKVSRIFFQFLFCKLFNCKWCSLLVQIAKHHKIFELRLIVVAVLTLPSKLFTK